jgi:hypothetical protein
MLIARHLLFYGLYNTENVMNENFEKKKKILFVFKGYTCRFESEAFASVASIALRP